MVKSKDSRVCSFHFVDAEPTTHNPTIKLGYDSIKRLLMFSPPVGKSKRTTESGLDYRFTVNKTSTMAGNKEEDTYNLAYWLNSRRILTSKG